MDQQKTGTPSFSLYQVGSDSSKACYQSSEITILSVINGPYFDRRKISLDPIFNCHLSGAALTADRWINMCRKLKEILKLMVVSQKYLRMHFDISFQIVEGKEEVNIFCALTNLLCFSLMLAGVQIRSTFSCACAWLLDQKTNWTAPKDTQNTKMMIVAQESAGKQIIHTEFSGDFSFLHFQKLTNILMDANEDFQDYMVKKVGEINQQLAEA